MLRGQDIIYFSNEWDADNKTSSHHIAGQLGKHNRILYVEASGLRSPSLSSHDIGKIFRKIKRFVQGLRCVDDNIYVYTPFILPFHKYKIIQRLNAFLLVFFLRTKCRELNFKNPILWIIIPHMVKIIGNLNEKITVYYCVDDFSSLPGVDAGAVALFDRELSSKADIIFTPSEPLYHKKRMLNLNTFLSPHGVDLLNFSKVFDDALPVPDDIKAIKKPIIGFFGLIEKWVDLDLVRYIAQKKPEWSVVMIGRMAQEINGFSEIENVYFLGPRRYETLPLYAKLFDIAIMPYALNNQVINANPIKLREYLAMGKPVVTVRTPETEKFSDVVRISDGHGSFVRNIEEALNKDSEEDIKKRSDRVKDSSWESRVDKISSIVTERLRLRYHEA